MTKHQATLLPQGFEAVVCCMDSAESLIDMRPSDASMQHPCLKSLRQYGLVLRHCCFPTSNPPSWPPTADEADDVAEEVGQDEMAEDGQGELAEDGQGEVAADGQDEWTEVGQGPQLADAEEQVMLEESDEEQVVLEESEEASDAWDEDA